MLPGRYNYFLGSDPSWWRTNVPAYASIRYRELYPGVDMVVRDHEGRLEYDLILESGADLEAIAVRCESEESLRLGDDGALMIETAAGLLQQSKSLAYQIDGLGDRERVACSYVLLADHRFGFDVFPRDRGKLVVIDPGLVYGTFPRGSAWDTASSVALDSSGAVIVTGSTYSADFPTSPGAFDTSYNGGSYGDGFVAKLSADGSSLLYGTFLGGTKRDGAYAMALDVSGAAVVTGGTASGDFPTTPGAYDRRFGGYLDAFVAKLSADGSSLLYGTFLGAGDGSDEGRAVAVDASGAAVVVGDTDGDVPTTPGACDPMHRMRRYGDAFVVKLVPSVCDNAAAWSNYGSGWPGTNGVPCLVSGGQPLVCGKLSLTICNSSGTSTAGLLLLGASATDLPTRWDGRLLVEPRWVLPLMLPPGGTSIPAMGVACDLSWCGLHWFLQVLELDPGASRGISFSQGLELTFGS
ncbi:MAG: hypothetical protein AB1486_31575 [Planctomycetota bacterium]